MAGKVLVLGLRGLAGDQVQDWSGDGCVHQRALEIDNVAHTCNPAPWEAEAGRLHGFCLFF